MLEVPGMYGLMPAWIASCVLRPSGREGAVMLILLLPPVWGQT
jgi:hypothetical protein